MTYPRIHKDKANSTDIVLIMMNTLTPIGVRYFNALFEKDYECKIKFLQCEVLNDFWNALTVVLVAALLLYYNNNNSRFFLFLLKTSGTKEWCGMWKVGV